MMTVTLLGYMGCGKSHISKLLSKELNFDLVDLDKKIISNEGIPIAEIFEKKGEIYFRKVERQTLMEVLEDKNSKVISLGGGTPVYYNNIDLINSNSTSFYLRTSVGVLTERLLLSKEKRPLIKHLKDKDLPEFVAKHLFDRNPFYNKAKFIIDTDRKEPENIMEEIISKLYL